MSELDLSLFKTSSHGTTVSSDESRLKIDIEYSWVGWFFLTFFGTTMTPKKVIFTCLSSNEVFEQLSSASKIQHFMLYRKK